MFFFEKQKKKTFILYKFENNVCRIQKDMNISIAAEFS
jgi:hypothetical protein